MIGTSAMIALAVVAGALCGQLLRRRALPPIDWRSLLARLPLPMLALAASYGVYSFALLFVPSWVAIVQAAAFELTYVGLAVTQGLGEAQRKRANGISIGAVAASIIYNTLAGWFHAQPQLLIDASAHAWLCLAILHGAPLAWVAYLVADLLLHDQPVAVDADAPQTTKDEGRRTKDEPQTIESPPHASPKHLAVSAKELAGYLPILAVFEQNPQAKTADLASAAGISTRTAESRRAELVKLGALHKTDQGYVRNGVELTAAE